MKKREQMLKDIETFGLRAIGQKELVKHLNGERLSPKEMCKAKCYDCLGFYADGRGYDCEIPECPIYPLQPYRSGPKYVGKVFSPEDKVKLADRMKLLSTHK